MTILRWLPSAEHLRLLRLLVKEPFDPKHPHVAAARLLKKKVNVGLP
jgi:hypothetical protein